jgi:hypothetical protein
MRKKPRDKSRNIQEIDRINSTKHYQRFGLLARFDFAFP